MKKPLIIGAVTLAALTALPAAASAQAYSYYGDRDRDGRYERWERRADQNRRDGRRYTDRERYNDWRRGQRDQWRDGRRWEREQRREYRRWQRGHVIPYNYRRSWYVDDYRRYGYRAPPRGYAYYRTDTGDVVLAAIATGVILSLLN
jgi:Ni/Co efflux regulator RcnB